MSDVTRVPPSAAAALATLVRVTLLRLSRGRALWVSLLIALLPATFAGLLGSRRVSEGPHELIQFLVMALLPTMFVASSLGEEIEDRTTTYLWSRPIGRWTIVAGKLLALAPLATLMVVGGAALAAQVARFPPPLSLPALAGGSLAISMLSAGLATLVPKHGMALSLIFIVVLDVPLGALPASIANISLTRQVALLSDSDAAAVQPAVTLAIIAAVWLAIALVRIRRLES